MQEQNLLNLSNLDPNLRQQIETLIKEEEIKRKEIEYAKEIFKTEIESGKTIEGLSQNVLRYMYDFALSELKENKGTIGSDLGKSVESSEKKVKELATRLEKETTILKLKMYIQYLRNERLEKVPVKEGGIPMTVRNAVFNKYKKENNLCQCCVCKTELALNTMHCGHIQPRKNGGLVEIGNLLPICPSCNASLSSNNLYEYAESKGIQLSL